MEFFKFLKKFKPRRRRSRYKKLMASCEENAGNLDCHCFFNIAREHLRNADDIMPPEKVAKDIMSDVLQQYKDERLRLDCVARQVIRSSQGFETDIPDFTIDREIFCKQLLIEVITLFAINKLDERQLLRELLTTLFPMSRSLDRKLFFFEEAYTVFPFITDFPSIKDKILYMLQHTAGWKVSSEDDPWKTAVVRMNPTYYLELPIPRASRAEGHSTLLAEALYRIQDKELLLSLLRHGVRPNAFYLWPVALLADLKILLNPRSLEDTAILAPEQAAILYFCRARRGFRRFLVNPEYTNQYNPRVHGEVDENLLIIPPATAFLVPDDWTKNPCPLQHYCRLVIRSQLCENDHLPGGISTLPVPSSLKDYLDLQC